MKAYLYPHAKPTSKAWYAYDVKLDGELVLTDSRDPEHELARVLLARGIRGKVTMHDGNTGKPRTMFTIEKAAKRCTDDLNMRFRAWKPFEARAIRPHSPGRALNEAPA